MALIYSFAPEHFFAFTSTNFPQYLSVMNGGARRSAQAFDNATAQKMRSITFEMPAFTGALTMKILFSIAATSGNVQFNGTVEAISSLAAINMNTTNSYDANNSSGAIAVPATTYNPKEFSITLTNNDSVAAGSNVMLAVERDVTVSSNASGLCYVHAVKLWDAS